MTSSAASSAPMPNSSISRPDRFRIRASRSGPSPTPARPVPRAAVKAAQSIRSSRSTTRIPHPTRRRFRRSSGCSDPLCGFLNTGTLPPSVAPPAPPAPPPEPVPAVPAPFSPFLGEVVASQTSAQQFINNLVGNGPAQLAALNTAPVFSTPPGGGARVPPQQQRSPAAGRQDLPPGFDRRIIDIPPLTETRLIKDEVVAQIATANMERLQAAVRTLGLTLIASENLGITGSTMVRLRITDGRTPQYHIQRLGDAAVVAV